MYYLRHLRLYNKKICSNFSCVCHYLYDGKLVDFFFMLSIDLMECSIKKNIFCKIGNKQKIILLKIYD